MSKTFQAMEQEKKQEKLYHKAVNIFAKATKMVVRTILLLIVQI